MEVEWNGVGLNVRRERERDGGKSSNKTYVQVRTHHYLLARILESACERASILTQQNYLVFRECISSGY